MPVRWVYKRLKINGVFCQVSNNQFNCDFKSVDSKDEYNELKISELYRLLRFFNGH